MSLTWETRIFVPWTMPFGAQWAETVLGSVVKPLVSDPSALEWFWFTRYVSDLGTNGDVGNCEIDKIPAEFFDSGGRHRSIRMRYKLRTDGDQEFETRARGLIAQANAAVSDFRPWDMLGDLGGDRFVGDPRTHDRRVRRADIIVDLLFAASRLALDCLVEADEGQWVAETNNDRESPNGSSFESPLHLFCNMTDVPVFVTILDTDGNAHAARVLL
jgi:hypothetical protein